jgi:hypothetical protein
MADGGAFAFIALSVAFLQAIICLSLEEFTHGIR